MKKILLSWIDSAGTITRELARIKLQYNMPGAAISEIAHLFRRVGIKVPIDARTICRTNVSPVGDENFVYLGFESRFNELKQRLQNRPLPTWQVTLFIDEIKLYRSSNKEFWLIVLA